MQTALTLRTATDDGDRYSKVVQPDKGFGFIAPQDGGKDVFVHITALQAAGISSLNDGQKVSYDVVNERGKMAAGNLKLG